MTTVETVNDNISDFELEINSLSENRGINAADLWSLLDNSSCEVAPLVSRWNMVQYGIPVMGSNCLGI